MADIDPITPPAADPPATPLAQSQQPPAAEQHVPYERFKAVNDQLKQLKEQINALDGEKQSTQAQQTTLEQRLATLETERANTQAENLRLKVASKKQLPDDLADRLRGSTQEELEADADRLLTFLKPKDGPGVPPPSSGPRKPALDLNKMTPSEIRKARAEGKI